MVNANPAINKGNYSLDTKAREESFHRKIGKGWEREYRLYRKHWREYPKKQFVSDYPLLADLELSTICNLNCPMCYTTTEEFKSKVTARFMDYHLYRKIIDEIAGKVSAVRLSLRGEPTLHPRFLDCISYAKRRGIREVSALTNGSKLTKDFFKRLMNAGMDWLTISIDGLGQAYENVRKPLKFKDIRQKIKDINTVKKENKTGKPVIKIQAVWPAISQDPQRFYDRFLRYTDLIAFNPLIDYLGKDKDITYEPDFTCSQLYQRLVIGSDGKALICANDEHGSNITGDANKESIYEIWNGKRLNKIRVIHKRKNGFMRIPVCRKCYLPRAADSAERMEVNGREFMIRNYIGREQTVGR